jgi:hypothetical protein
MAEGAEVSPFLARTTLRWLKPFHTRSIKLKVIFKPWYLDPQGLPDEGKVSRVVIGAVWLVLAFWSWAPSCILGLSSTGSELTGLGVGSQSHLQNSASGMESTRMADLNWTVEHILLIANFERRMSRYVLLLLAFG